MYEEFIAFEDIEINEFIYENTDREEFDELYLGTECRLEWEI